MNKLSQFYFPKTSFTDRQISNRPVQTHRVNNWVPDPSAAANRDLNLGNLNTSPWIYFHPVSSWSSADSSSCAYLFTIQTKATSIIHPKQINNQPNKVIKTVCDHNPATSKFFRSPSLQLQPHLSTTSRIATKSQQKLWLHISAISCNIKCSNKTVTAIVTAFLDVVDKCGRRLFL